MGTRRPNHSGCIDRQGKRWRGSVMIDGHRRYVYGHSRSEVAAKLRQLVLSANRPRQQPRLTVGAYLAAYLDGQSGRLRPRTLAGYRIIAARWQEALGHVPLTRLSRDAIAEALATWRAAGLSDGTLLNQRTFLCSALGAAVRDGLLDSNPAAFVRLGPPRRRKPPTLTPELVRSVLAAVRDTPVDLPVRVTLATGLRLGELLGLCWQDLDTERAVLTVTHQLQRLSGRYELVAPKTAAGVRTLPLGALALDALHQRRVQQAEERLRAGARWQDRWGLVWTTPSGAPRHGSVLTEQLGKVLERAGLPVLRWHDLRHATATLLLAAGVNPRVVQEQLGHADVGITLGVYSHVPFATLQQAMQRLDALLRG